MESLLLEILRRLRDGGHLGPRELARLIDDANRQAGGPERAFSKKRLLPYYLETKRERPRQWEGWEVDAALERRLFETLRMKPRRTASGVATVTVITKPWPCSDDCLYCPSDMRMPKSYLHDEPACQRAERNFFDPYLQVSMRLRALAEMGHVCDKVELIVLGGTWTDYPDAYRTWFVSELFRALNEKTFDEGRVRERRKRYEQAGIAWEDGELSMRCAPVQRRVDAGELRYAQAFSCLYGAGSPWERVAGWQRTGADELEEQQRRNETAAHRAVGLVIETRPDTIDAESLRSFRELGCTKVQLGVQSLRQEVLDANERTVEVGQMRRAFELLRLFGFKIHAHFMVNLLGSDVEGDKRDYHAFVHDAAFSPDEVKLYPCALIEGTRLCACYDAGAYRPYSHDELMDVLVYAETHTPAFTRISRMIRDFSSDDIVAGNKKPNLRQMVEGKIAEAGLAVEEIRYREVSTADVELDTLALRELRYKTTVSEEVFLQWVTPTGAIAGFLRLSLPREDALARYAGLLPVQAGEAMIREVHVYGRVADLHASGPAAQHHGLGRRLVERACEIARQAGYGAVNVISAVGTREYYRKLGFSDGALYQRRGL